MRRDLIAISTYNYCDVNTSDFRLMVIGLVTSYGSDILPRPMDFTIRLAEYFLLREEFLEDSGICFYDHNKKLKIRLCNN